MARSHRTTVLIHADRQAPRVARRVIEEFAAGLPDEFVQQLKLLASELVTNSVQHVSGGASVGVELTELRAGVRVVVRDAGNGFDLERLPPPSARGGWGLRFLGELAERWGTERGSDGSAVWFELALDAHQTPAGGVTRRSGAREPRL